MEPREELIDLIYETVLEPDLWVTVMERLADILGGNSGWLSRISDVDGTGSGLLARIDPVEPRRYADYYGSLNFFVQGHRPGSESSAWRPQITTERDYTSTDDLKRSEYYNDFMCPQDVYSVMTVSLARKCEQVSSLNIHRGRKREPFGATEIAFTQSLHPHLVRAFRLGEKFLAAHDQARPLAAVLDRLGQGVVITDARRRVFHANGAAERMLSGRDGIGVVNGRLTATHPPTANRLEALILSAFGPDVGACRGGVLTVEGARGAAFSVSVAPLRTGAAAILAEEPAVLVVIQDITPSDAHVGRRLSEQFGLTQAEVRVALALLAGDAPRSVAERFAVSINTIRSQMASIFGKTGTAGQTDLLRLMLQLGTKE